MNKLKPCGIILVTGGAGFIGSHLVDKLIRIESVEKVIVLDNLWSGKIENIKKYIGSKKFELIIGDVRDQKLMKKLVKNSDYVFHEAAVVSVQFSLEKPEVVNEVNVCGTLNLLEACLDSDLHRFVFASSAAVYGETKVLPIREELSGHPLSPYGASKLAAEAYCIAFYKSYGVKTVSLRYFNVYGPRQAVSPYSGVITIFMNNAKYGKPLTIFGDGKQTRDFIHVWDVVEATILASIKEKAIGEVINIGTGKDISIKKLAELVRKVTGREDLPIEYGPPRKGDIKRSCANIEKARKILGFTPKINLEDGLKTLIG